jgi:hypothetical protein
VTEIEKNYARGCIVGVFGCVGLVVVAFVGLMVWAWIRIPSHSELERDRQARELAEQEARPAPDQTPSSPVAHASFASPEDVRQAEEFLESLPAVCAESSAEARTDGSVTIHVRCDDGSDALDSEMSIKDGIVRELK